jgi:hypothetical protein
LGRDTLIEIEKKMDNESFLEYYDIHSKTPRALFHIKDINRLCKMTGYPEYTQINKTSFYERKGNQEIMPEISPVYEEEMTPILKAIKENSK